MESTSGKGESWTAKEYFRSFGNINQRKALEKAGIPVSTAHDYEQLAGPREQQAQQAADAAADLYIVEKGH